ncbi:hypothetical protein OHB49_43160 (plasmid) [Streptomyces sp. NBC_01717]|uniref:hypothetical protein n=1 Tax=Streptomyces sp. NBC_01717 TaxID=2975918 RepID=UPI002E355DA6|nr:hypothetical protein [Streptomyces sp. NBC_01717]
MVDERGTAQQRIEGARALIAIADLVQFDRHLGRLLQSDVIDVCQDDMRATVDRGIRRVAADDRIPFDLDLRLALLTIAMRRFDEPAATDAMRRLVAANLGDRAPRELAEAHGSSL